MAVKRRFQHDNLNQSLTRPLAGGLDMSVVYCADGPDQLDQIYDDGAAGYTYAREGHPNAARLASHIDDLEGAEGGLITSSGMSAVSAVLLGLLKAGDHVVGGDQLYGRSLRLLSEDLPRLGIETSLADPTNADGFRAAIRPNTKAIFVEVVSNPTLRVADMPALAEIAQSSGAMLIVDNTFTTPLAFQPFAHGADVVIHSVTKLLSGHSDVTLGYVVARDPAVNDRLAVVSASLGLNASPFDCWQAERGLLSFHLRYQRAEENAKSLAKALAEFPNVRRVLYPGHANHPDHALAHALLGERFGNMVSFEIEPTRAAARKFVEAAPSIAFAPTLGDVATTLSHPPSSSHRALSPQAQAARGISEGFFRVSVGVEPIDELISTFRIAAQSLG